VTTCLLSVWAGIKDEWVLRLVTLLYWSMLVLCVAEGKFSCIYRSLSALVFALKLYWMT